MTAMRVLPLVALALAAGGCATPMMQEIPSMPATARMGLKTFTETTPRAVGNYDVTFTFGDPKKPTVNWVKFEGRRVALVAVKTQPGQISKATFTARVKGPIARDDEPTGEAPYPYALNLTVVSNADKMPSPEVVRNDASRVIYLCGDSTVTDQQGEPWGSWGQCLSAFFGRGTAVANFARSGLTTQSFLQQKRLDRILAHLKVGDLVLIQFGHNDQKAPWLKPFEGYQEKLNLYLDKIEMRGAKAIIISPMERLRFDRNGNQEGRTLADYAQAAREVAESRGVGFIDLNAASWRMYGAMGAKAAPRLFCTASIEQQLRDYFGEQGRTDGKELRELKDKTHHSIYGAYVLAHYIADEVVRLCPEFKRARRVGVEPANPDAPEPDPMIPPTGVVDTTRPEGDVGNKE